MTLTLPGAKRGAATAAGLTLAAITIAGEHAALLLAPLVLRGCNPFGLPEMKVEVSNGQAGPRSEGARERPLPGRRQPSHEDASAYGQGGISHRRWYPV